MKGLVPLLICFVAIGLAQDDLTLGKSAFEKKSYDDAIQHFQKYLVANSRNVDANFMLGESYRLKGDLQNALTALERVLDFDDEHEQALASIIRVYGKLGMWDKAAKRFKEAEKYHKKGILAPLAYGQTFLETDSLDKASIYFSKVKEIDPKNADVYIGLAEVYARQNVIVLAVDNLRTATQLKPNDPTLWYKLATTILKNRGLNSAQIQEIIAALQKSIELDPTNDKAIYDAANTMYRTKVYWREAAEFFKKYVELKKDNADAWEKYAISAYNAKVYADAVPILEQAIALNPKSYELKPMLAHCYYLVREYQKALDIYKSIPADSLGKDEVFRIGFSYFQLKDTVNAISYFEKTAGVDTVYDKAYADAIGSLAGISWSQKKYDQASIWYGKLLEKDPKNINALYFSGLSAANIDKPDTAKRFFKQLVLLRPTTFGYRYYLAQAYSNQDSIEQSKFHYHIVLDQVDSVNKAEPAKAAQNIPLVMGVYRALALFDYKEKNITASIEKLEKAVSYEKEKKDENLHLFLAQMYAVQSGNADLLEKEAKVIREKACKEYALVLKINPKNVSAKKESAQMKCGQ